MALLSGLRVVEFTAAAAGPYAGMMLADLGAEVIKVEPPRGDHSRQWGSWHVDNKSFMFLAVNRNKGSVIADLMEPEDRAKIHELLKTADIVIESLAPGGSEKLGIDYNTCKSLREDIIYCSISGFGRTGPLRGELGMDMMLQAQTGILSFMGEPDRPPVRVAVSAIDLMTGTMAFAAILAALRDRDSSGKGQFVEASLYDTGINLLLWAVPMWSATGAVPEKFGGEYEQLFPYGVFTASDGYFYLGVSTLAHWRRFCTATGLDELHDDPRFASNTLRVQHRAELREILARYFGDHTLSELADRLKPAGVAFAKILSVDEVLGSEHVRARESIRALPGYEQVMVATAPFRMERGFSEKWTTPPDLGSHQETYVGSRNDS
jgi:formyl-CoA transferase